MSKQLSLSAFASIAAMALFALTSGIDTQAPHVAQADQFAFAPSAFAD